VEGWIVFGVVVLAALGAFVAWAIRTGNADQKWWQLFMQNLQDKYGSSDLNEIYERELQPAVDALKSGDYYAVTTLYTKLTDDLSSVSSRIAVSDLDIRFAKKLFDEAREAFLKKCNLFEPTAPLGSFFGPTQPVEFGGTYVPARTMKYGSDWVSSGAEIFPLIAVTDVEVYADGQKLVNYTSRASLSSAMLGAVLPGSSLLWAVARPKVTRHVEDDREACILVSGENFELELEIDPKEKKDARFFAKELQRQVEKSKGLQPSDSKSKKESAKSKAESQDGQVGVSLEKLTEMYAAGLLTAEEFSDLKKNL
jgi:hypothetical protein